MSICEQELNKFHDDHVVLVERLKKTIRERARTNRERIKTNLKEAENPGPIGFRQQGSYKMGTMIRADDEKYDIDDGLYFKPDDLSGMKPLDVREMICTAAKDSKFNEQPEIKTSCVRIYYSEGFHIDVPTYKKEDGEKPLLASGDEWIESDPKAVTEWFKDSADQTGNADGVRKVVRLLKKFVDCYAGEDRISGLAISALVIELWDFKNGAKFDLEDVLYKIMKSIRNRLSWYRQIKHPVISNENIVNHDDPTIIEFQEKLAEAILNLSVLDLHDYSKKDALFAWDKVFPCDFFKNESDGGNSSVTKATIAGGVAGVPPVAIAKPPKPWACK